MAKFFLIVTAALVVLVLVLFLLWRAAANKQKRTKATLDKTVKQLHEAIEQQARLESTIDILKANRKEADEKIDDLHNGDAVSNALDELHKRKN